MKRFLFVIILSLFTNQIFAKPVNSIPFKVYQPNGDSILIVQRGDEYCSWYETLNGYVIDKDSSNNWVYINTNNDNNIILTNQIVNNTYTPYGINLNNIFATIENRRQFAYNLLNADALLAPNLEDEETALAVQQGKILNTTQAKAPAKNKGAINVLTILIEFQDVKFEYPTTVKDYFEDLMDGENFKHPNNKKETIGSVRKYWEEASYGQLSINSTIVGPYTANFNRIIYGTNWIKEDPTSDAMTLLLVYEAASKAAKEINMSDFDNNNDGIVDFVHVVFAGCDGSEYSKAIWSHKGYIPGILRDGVWVSKYIVTPEKENDNYASIGTICHEMGHAFGAPDFYDTDDDKSGGDFKGTGKWDLMKNGNYNNSGDSPAHPNPYIKTMIYGWAKAKELSGNDSLYTLRPAELDSNSIYKLSTSTPNEYYLLENRQGFGLPGTGLIIYHVNSEIENVNRWRINIGHPQNLYVVDASNKLPKPTGSVASYDTINSPDATFKDTITNNIFFTSQTKPSNCDWAGNITQNKDVCFISEEEINGEKCIKFVLNPEIEGPDVLCDSAVYSIENVPADATIEWTYVTIPGMTLPDVPVHIGSGQGTTKVYYKRGVILKGGTFQDTIDNPDIPFLPVPFSRTAPTFVPYSGNVTLKANITFNGNTHSLFKTINIPSEIIKVEIEELNLGLLNAWFKGVTKTISLTSTSEEDWMDEVIWYIDLPGRVPYYNFGSSISVTPSDVGMATIIATHSDGCGEFKSDTVRYQIVQLLGTSFANPVSGSVEISITGGDELNGNSNVSTIALDDQISQYIGACRLELWHDVYGKVREMDVPENTSVVTMDLGGLSSGIYVLRLIVDNQIIETSQMIIN